MHFISLLFTLSAVCSGVPAIALGSADSPCPLPGPDFPAPSNPTNSTAVQAAVAAFKSAIASALGDNSSSLPLDPVGTTFSFEAWSAAESDPIYTYHYDATGLQNATQGVSKVNSDTVYRVGSLSKLLTVYTWLATDGYKHWQSPITDFIPELAAYDAAFPQSNAIDIIHWSDITIASLASHLSGIQKDPALPAAVYTVIDPLPLPAAQDIPENATGLTCDTYSYIPCTRETFINSILVTHPVHAPSASPIYSDMAFSLLSLALENITSTPFPTLFQNNFIAPLNLTSTLYYAPNLTTSLNAIIPINDTYASFTANLSLIQPAGGYYSTINDITRIGRSVLSSALITPTQTRTWLKPAVFLSNGVSAVGAPWEIYQTPSTNTTVWMYTKSGDFGAYASYLILLPEYDTGFSILAAGANTTLTSQVLADIATSTFAPAFEAAAKEEAASKFTGDYAGSAENIFNNGTNAFEMTVTTDAFPGMRIANYTVDSLDMIAALAELEGTDPADVQLRLYPSGLTAPGANGTTLAGFRMIKYTPASEVAAAGQVFSNPRCQEWFNVGGVGSGTEYGAGGGLDEFAFVVGGDGKVTGMVVKTWDAMLQKA